MIQFDFLGTTTQELQMDITFMSGAYQEPALLKLRLRAGDAGAMINTIFANVV